jgi:putative SOS response-associated peptidase YedK
LFSSKGLAAPHGSIFALLHRVVFLRPGQEARSGEWIRTFAIITTDANALVADIHERMPAILDRTDYLRWLGEEESPRELMRPFPSEAMRLWPISTRVNKPENDDPSILDEIVLGAEAAE